MPTGKVRIWWDKDLQGYYVDVPYNKAFIEGLKAVIPASDRAHDFDKHLWTITERYFPAIKIVAERLYPGNVLIITKEQTERAASPAAVQKKSMDDVLLDFVKLLPAEALQKAYRVAAMALHPDRGGDMTKMSQLNALWQRIEAEKILKNGH